jgi:hypothetical protein
MSDEQRNVITHAMLAQNLPPGKEAWTDEQIATPYTNPYTPADKPMTPGPRSLDPGSGYVDPREYHAPASAAWADIAPGVSLSGFNNYHWQQDPANRSLLDTTTNYGMVPGPYSIGGLASNSFGTDPYANANNPALSGHVTPYGGSGPPAPGYFASLAGDMGAPGQPAPSPMPGAAPAPALPPIPTPASANSLYSGLV